LRRLLVAVAVIVVAWTAVQRLHRQSDLKAPVSDSVPAAVDGLAALPQQSGDGDGQFHCDGRIYCSQMRSCDEAKFFLAHCPGVKMDGDGNGIPCERQFCGHP